MLAETFVELLKDPAHWEFEILLMVLFDGLIGALAWPFLKSAIAKHDEKKHPKCDHDEVDVTRDGSHWEHGPHLKRSVFIGADPLPKDEYV